MAKSFYQISLKAIIKNKKGEVLLLKALDQGSLSGYWDLPGGRIEDHEFNLDLHDILRREIIEEAGDLEINIKDKPVAVGRQLVLKKISGYEKDIMIFMVFYEADYLAGEIKISAEHQEFKWVDLSKIDFKEYFTSGILTGLTQYYF